MSLDPRRFVLRYGKYLTVALGVALFVGTLLLSIQMLTREARSVRQFTATGSWMASQVERELQRFIHAVDLFALGAPTIDKRQLVRRFDIFWSRIDVVMRGTEGEALRNSPAFLSLMEDLLFELRVTDPELKVLEKGDTSAAEPIVERFSGFVKRTHHQVQDVMTTSEEFFTRERLNTVIAQLILSMLGVLGAGSLLIVMLIRELRRSTALVESEHRARQSAEKASFAKTSFLANMSHELRTPLNAIIGFSEMMRTRIYGPLGNEKYEDYVRDTHESAVHLLDIINTILEMSKIEAGATTLHEDPIEVAELLRSCTRLFEERASAKGISVTVGPGRDGPMLHADPRLVKQCLLNLLSNAVKFTRPGGTIAAFARIDEAGRIRIEVRDTGIGMTAAELRVALTAFGQIENSYTRLNEGTGLGLPLSKELAELHDGSLSILSEAGRGTTAVLLFPSSRTIPVSRECLIQGRSTAA